MSDLSNAFEAGMSYAAYCKTIQVLLEQGKTSGENQSEALLHYTQLNDRRMKRIYKITRLSDRIIQMMASWERKINVLVLTEAWCGDAAQNIPVLAKVFDGSSIRLRMIWRDEHLDIMDQFLTNGGRSIPKAIFMDAETGELLGEWGPRPEIAQKMAMDHKQDPLESKEAFSERLQLWYAKNKGENLQDELMNLLQMIK